MNFKILLNTSRNSHFNEFEKKYFQISLSSFLTYSCSLSSFIKDSALIRFNKNENIQVFLIFL